MGLTQCRNKLEYTTVTRMNWTDTNSNPPKSSLWAKTIRKIETNTTGETLQSGSVGSQFRGRRKCRRRNACALTLILCGPSHLCGVNTIHKLLKTEKIFLELNNRAKRTVHNYYSRYYGWIYPLTTLAKRITNVNPCIEPPCTVRSHCVEWIGPAEPLISTALCQL